MEGRKRAEREQRKEGGREGGRWADNSETARKSGKITTVLGI